MNELETKIKHLIIDALNLEDVTVDDIDSSEALFVDGLGLDSIDALELGIALQKESIHQAHEALIRREGIAY